MDNSQIILIGVLLLFLALLIGYYSYSKGKGTVVDFLVGFLLSLLVSPLIAFLVVLIFGGTKCPHCRSRVEGKAVVCPGCQRELSPKTV